MRRDSSQRSGAAPSIRLATAVYRAGLALLPSSFRERHGDQMLRVFRELCADAHAESGATGVARAFARAGAGVAQVAVAERLRPGRSRSPRTHGDPVLTRWISDTRQSVRTLILAPTFTVVSILTLGLGVGASTAIFSVVHAVLIEGLPYDEPDRLVYLDHKAPPVGFEGGLGSAAGLYLHYLRYARGIECVSYFEPSSVTVTGGGRSPERVPAMTTTASLFRCLRIRPALGRLLAPADDEPDGPRAVVLAHDYWQRRFGGDPAAVGSDLVIAGASFSIVGVLPAGSRFGDVDLFLDDDRDHTENFNGFNGGSVARLEPGVTLEALRSELDRQIAQIDKTYADPLVGTFLRDSGVAAVPMSLRDQLVGPVEQVLWILMGSVGLVMLIACANVANLFLVRAEARQREVALRHALGATRARVLARFLNESVVLSLVGCTVGLVLARLATTLLLSRVPFDLPRAEGVGLDLPVLLFAVGTSIAAAVVFGALPMLRRRGDLVDALRDGGRAATTGRTPMRLRQGLVVAQVALSLVLLSGAGLMARSFVRLAAVDPGFVADGVLTFRLSLPSRQYPEDAAAVAFHDRLIERLQALPGVQRVGGTRDLPLSGRSGGDVMVRESDPPAEGEVPPVVWATRVTPTYFETLGIPLLRGRGITRRDQEEESPVVVIDQAAVDIFFGGADPVGERVRLGVDPGKEWLEVVGVVGSTKRETLAEAPTPMAYISTSIESFNSARLMSYALRVDGNATGLAEPIRAVVGSMDPDLPIIGLRTMDRIVAEAEAPMAFTMVMIGIAAAAALLLGSVGVYGVVSFIVGHRTAEIGIRMALGATGRDVHRLLLGQGAIVGAVGLVVGLAGTLLLAGAVQSQLYGVDALDPLTHAATSATLLAVVLLATWVPARRASRIDPNVALRGE